MKARLLVGLLLVHFAAPSYAQTYEETIKFIVTGNRTLSEVSYRGQGIDQRYLKTEILALDPSNCTATIKQKYKAVDEWGMVLDKRDVAACSIAAHKPPRCFVEYEFQKTIQFNAIAHWRIKMNEKGLVELAMHGVGRKMMDISLSIPLAADPQNRNIQTTCAGPCDLLVHLETDIARLEKAWAYLQQRYCPPPKSAF